LWRALRGVIDRRQLTAVVHRGLTEADQAHDFEVSSPATPCLSLSSLWSSISCPCGFSQQGLSLERDGFLLEVRRLIDNLQENVEAPCCCHRGRVRRHHGLCRPSSKASAQSRPLPPLACTTPEVASAQPFSMFDPLPPLPLGLPCMTGGEETRRHAAYNRWRADLPSTWQCAWERYEPTIPLLNPRHLHGDAHDSGWALIKHNHLDIGQHPRTRRGNLFSGVSR
jgi:hypothetical protein